jgi:hypothetical protein
MTLASSKMKAKKTFYKIKALLQDGIGYNNPISFGRIGLLHLSEGGWL